MHYFGKVSIFVFIVVVFAFGAPQHGKAAYYTTQSIQEQINALYTQIQRLQAELAAQTIVASPNCYQDIYNWSQYCIPYANYYGSYYYGMNDGSDDDILEDITVVLNRIGARVTIEYDNDNDYFFFNTTDRNEIVYLIRDNTNLSERAIRNVISYNGNTSNRNNDDIDSIRVDFRGDDANIRVEFEDGDTDRFTLRNVDDDEDEVISRLANRYDVSERDIEDVIDFD